MTCCPKVMFGTNRPSMTSQCTHRRPAASKAESSAARLPTSAERREGERIIGAYLVGLRRCRPSNACRAISSLSTWRSMSSALVRAFPSPDSAHSRSRTRLAPSMVIPCSCSKVRMRRSTTRSASEYNLCPFGVQQGAATARIPFPETQYVTFQLQQPSRFPDAIRPSSHRVPMRNASCSIDYRQKDMPRHRCVAIRCGRPDS